MNQKALVACHLNDVFRNEGFHKLARSHTLSMIISRNGARWIGCYSRPLLGSDNGLSKTAAIWMTLNNFEGHLPTSSLAKCDCDFYRMWTHVHVRYMLSPVRLSSVTFVRPTQRVVIFGNISTPWPSVDIHGKFYGGRLRGTHPCNNINATLSNTKNRTMLSTKSNVASTLLPFLATKSNIFSTESNVASTLLLVWTGL